MKCMKQNTNFTLQRNMSSLAEIGLTCISKMLMNITAKDSDGLVLKDIFRDDRQNIDDWNATS